MLRLTLLLAIASVIFLSPVKGQDETDYSGIDKMLVYGEYDKMIDTCKKILATDSLNAEIWYKIGLAYRNMHPDENSFDCFMKAYMCDPRNNLYKFNLAKGFFNKNKNLKAKPLLIELCAADSMNYDYAFYLTSIYMEEGTYDEAIKIYNIFYNNDSSNYVILDRLGFANLRKGKIKDAIGYYEKSLNSNSRNIDAIRNLSFLYPYVHKIDTAITLLSRAIEMDDEDIDLYARRGTIYWAKNYNKLALNDYLKILSLGDSSFLYLKRAGIGYSRNMQPDEGLVYLLKAHPRDTSDYETIDYIAQCYSMKQNFSESVTYYEKIIELLWPLSQQLGITHLNTGQTLSMDNQYISAAQHYLKSYELTKNPSMLMLIANAYDENLGNPAKAIPYYRQFLSQYKNAKVTYTPEYVNAIRERLKYIEEKQAESKKPAPSTTGIK